MVVTAKPFVAREEDPFLLEEKKLEPEDSVDIDPSFVAVSSPNAEDKSERVQAWSKVHSLDSKFSSGSKSLVNQ